MGEAKRRKLLDPNFGIAKNADLIVKGQTLTLRPIELPTCVDLSPGTGKFKLYSNPENTYNEYCFVKIFLCQLLDFLIEELPIEAQKFAMVFDCKEIKSKEIITLKITTDLNGFSPTRRRLWHVIPMPIKIVLDALNDENIEENLDANEEFEDSNTRVGTPKKEHTRSAHLRRVAYGKGRSLRKWVEISETVVNAK